MTGDRERCLAAGMDDYLAKPLRKAAFDELMDRLGIGAAPGGSRSTSSRRSFGPVVTQAQDSGLSGLS